MLIITISKLKPVLRESKQLKNLLIIFFNNIFLSAVRLHIDDKQGKRSQMSTSIASVSAG